MKFEFKGFYFIFISDRIVRKLGKLISLGDSAMAITIYPFIFIKNDKRNDKELLRHESIHIIQQLELLIIIGWLLFIGEYCYARYVKKLDARQSYYFTSFEQEAHRNSMKIHYLATRKPYAILKYITHKKLLSRYINNQLIIRDFN